MTEKLLHVHWTLGFSPNIITPLTKRLQPSSYILSFDIIKRPRVQYSVPTIKLWNRLPPGALVDVVGWANGLCWFVIQDDSKLCSLDISCWVRLLVVSLGYPCGSCKVYVRMAHLSWTQSNPLLWIGKKISIPIVRTFWNSYDIRYQTERVQWQHYIDFTELKNKWQNTFQVHNRINITSAVNKL